MIGGHRIAQLEQHPCSNDRRDRSRLGVEVHEERRLLNICALLVPSEEAAGGNADGLPLFGAFEHICVLAAELLARDAGGHDFGDLLLGGPDVVQEDLFTIRIGSQRFGRQVDVDRTCNRVCHHQRW